LNKIQIANVLAEQAKKMGPVYDHEQFGLLSVQLRAGEAVPAHAVNTTAIVIVRSGEVVFDVEGTEVQLTAEDVLQFEPNEMHSLVAVTDVDLVVVRFK
jgi:quercetin dioxygenase-like cupin family protein